MLQDDRYACMADVGWITGHTYIVYGPLASEQSFYTALHNPVELTNRSPLDGVTTTIFESTPVYPTPSRFWETVAKHKLTQFYTGEPLPLEDTVEPKNDLNFSPAPTAIRLLRRLGEQHVKGHDLSSLRTIGSVGEPINPEVRFFELEARQTALTLRFLIGQAWDWYWEHVGNKECAVVDTYWQTETGSIIITCVLASSRSPAPGN